MALHPDVLPHAERPSLVNQFREGFAGLEASLLPLSAPQLFRAPRGRASVVLLPGFMASPASMAPLAAYLRFLGHRVRGWGLGRNLAGVEAMIDEFKAELEAREDEPVALVAWSLGGVVARETAREMPDKVSQVITMGTPVVGGPKYTSVPPGMLTRESMSFDEIEQEVHRRNLQGLKQPITAMYSKSDGVVGWKAAVDIYNPHARNIEVSGTHLGLGTNPSVWLETAKALAA